MVELLRCPRFRPRRVALLMASALCLLTAVSPAGAAAGPDEDLVAGTGQGIFPTEFGAFSAQVHVDAIGDETDARGHTMVRVENTPIGEILVDGSVFCVNADGNQATIGIVVERSNFFAPGTMRLRKVIDNGQGPNDPPDQTGATAFPPQTTCPPPALTPIPTGPVDQGNFVVEDGA